MSNKKSLLGSGWAMVTHNKRYIFWFWWLNLTLAEFGTASFRKSAHAILDHSMVADRLLHGFDVAVLINLLARPELGPMSAATTPALYFSFLFLIFTALFLPGVFQGYASTYRLPREDFFRACGRNLWRYLRLMFIAGIVMGIVAGLLFAINGAIVKKGGDSTNEVLPFELQMVGLAVIFLVMTTLRIWFDLAEVDVVLSDQRAVRKSLWTGLQHTLRSLLRLLASYVVATLLAAIILAGGILAWMKFVAPENWLGAFVVSQLTLLLLLIPRFWQRGVAVTFWQQSMMVPVVAAAPVIPAFTPAAIPVPPATPPSPAPEGA
jgi:sterol desaturase/sphingolipid hydroxylase (fatty acid hydroxylase superfamily)